MFFMVDPHFVQCNPNKVNFMLVRDRERVWGITLFHFNKCQCLKLYFVLDLLIWKIYEKIWVYLDFLVFCDKQVTLKTDVTFLIRDT